MHHRAGSRPCVIKGTVKRHFLGRPVTIDERARSVKAAESRRVEPSETGPCRRYQQPAIIGPGLDIAGAAAGQPAIEDGFCQQADLLTKPCLATHDASSLARAVAKKF